MRAWWAWCRYRVWYWLEGAIGWDRFRAIAYDRWCAAHDEWEARELAEQERRWSD